MLRSPEEYEVFQYSDSDVEALKAYGLPAIQRLVIVPVYMSCWQICGGISDTQQINVPFKQSSPFERRRQKTV